MNENSGDAGKRGLRAIITQMADDAILEAVAGGKFDRQFEGLILDSIKRAPDNQPLTRIGFVLKIAAWLIELSPNISFQDAKARAERAYRQLVTDTGVKFGCADYDWTGMGARVVANEYEIAF